MRQLESNQFDKGMSLDTNPIAMDNHTLANALNATMITMNGNELVLLNDMGNAKVESAHLPSGYVPVGMKEYGGIVYVASYNPLEKKSQIGCFPSPERNLSGEDLGTPACILDEFVNTLSSDTEITKTYDLKLLIKGPIRPGDKFLIYNTEGSAYNTLLSNVTNNVIDVKVVVIDAEGASIDITDSLKKVSSNALPFVKVISSEADLSENDYSIYKDKIAGSIYLQESLVIPSYVTVGISGKETLDEKHIEITFIPQAFNADGTEWTRNTLTYSIEANITGTGSVITESSVNTITITKPDKDTHPILNYTVIPQYSYGKVGILKKSGSLDISLIGTGEIVFNQFRYYNNTVDGIITLEYDIAAYLNDTQRIESVGLEYYEVQSTGLLNSIKPVALLAYLSMETNFGSFSTNFDYGDGLELGKMYVGRLRVVRRDSKESVTKYSKFFGIITSAITNEYYMDNPDKSMIELDGDEPQEFILDWKSDWEEEQLGDTFKDENPNDTNIHTGTSMPATKPSDNTIRYTTVRTGKVSYKFTPKITVDTIDDYFPFDLTVTPTVTCKRADSSYSIPKIPALGNLTITGKPETCAKKDVSASLSGDGIAMEKESISNDKDLSIEFNYQLTSKYFATLAKGDSSEDPYRLTYSNSNCPAMVPYMSMYTRTYDMLSRMVGTELYYTENGDKFSDIRPDTWWTFGTWKGSKNARVRSIGFMHADEYNKAKDPDHTMVALGEQAAEPDEFGNMFIFSTTSTNANWRFYSKATMDYANNLLGVYPAFFFWSGAGDHCTKLCGAGSPTNNFAIPMFLNTNGEMYPVAQYGRVSSSEHPLKLVILSFENIYIYQEGLEVSYTYYKSSDNVSDYWYNQVYTAEIEVNVQTTPTLALNKESRKYYNEKSTIQLPDGKFGMLPIFKLAEGSTSYSTVIAVVAPDLVEHCTNYLAAEPALGSVALIPTSNNDSAIVSYAYDVDLTTKRDFNTSHVYFLASGSGASSKLVDCTANYLTNTPNTKGLKIAQAIKDKVFKVIYSNDLEYNCLFVNSTNTSNAILNNTSMSIGDNGKLTKLSDIASRHIISRQLFDGLNQIR